jgi:hypothetical protein
VFDPDDPGPDYELAWPRELFVAEARAITSGSSECQDAVELLLEEAFSSDAPVHDFHNEDSVAGFDVDFDRPVPASLLRRLLSASARLPTRADPAPYWRRRRHIPSSAGLADKPDRMRQLQTDWAHIVNDLQQRGYLDRIAPRPCVDDDHGPMIASDDVINGEIERRVGIVGAWPLRPWVAGWERDAQQRRGCAVRDRQQVQCPAPQRGSARRLRRGVPRLAVLVVPGNNRAHQPPTLAPADGSIMSRLRKRS